MKPNQSIQFAASGHHPHFSQRSVCYELHTGDLAGSKKGHQCGRNGGGDDSLVAQLQEPPHRADFSAMSFPHVISIYGRGRCRVELQPRSHDVAVDVGWTRCGMFKACVCILAYNKGVPTGQHCRRANPMVSLILGDEAVSFGVTCRKHRLSPESPRF